MRSGGGVLGVLLGGVLTDVLNWHWIFLVNIRVGAFVFVLALRLLPPLPRRRKNRAWTLPAPSP